MSFVRRFILILFIIFSGAVLYTSIFSISTITVANIGEYAGKSAIVAGSIAAFILLAALIKLVRSTKLLDSIWSIVIPFTILAIGQLYVALRLEIMPFTDEARIQIQAYRLLDDSTPKWMNYFSYYPNNVSTPIIYSWFYWVFEILHIPRDYWAISTHILQSILLIASFLLLTLVIRKRNKLLATGFSILVATSFPVYMLVLPTYTDPLVIIMLLIILSIIFTNKFAHNLTQFALLGFLFGVAYVVKQNSLIIFIAFLILVLVTPRLDWKRKIVGIGLVVLLFSVVTGSQSKIERMYGYETKNELVIPRTNWIMMGLNPNTSGQIDGDDAFAFTSLKDQSTKEDLGIQEIKRRINVLGIKGLISHAFDKLILQYSRGAMDSSSINTVRTSGEPFYADKAYFLPVNLSQFVYVSVIVFSLVGALIYWRKGVFDEGVMFSIISMLGISAFHILFWEVEARYEQITLPFLLIMGAYGLSALAEVRVPVRLYTGMKLIGLLAMSVLVGFGLHRGLQPFTDQYRILQGKTYGSPMTPYMESNEIKLKPGDELSFKIKKPIKNNEYIFFNPLITPDTKKFIDFKNLDTGRNSSKKKAFVNNGSIQMPLSKSRKGYEVLVKNTSDQPLTIFYYLQSGAYRPDDESTAVLLNDVKKVDVRFMYYLYSQKKMTLISSQDVVRVALVGSLLTLGSGIMLLKLQKRSRDDLFVQY
ncbi:glycosyltransferase family protein [Weissella confusa]|uniref:hypothetical protein n=1 Tax=Weissella confusa TaxID=1583 RepID=UPI00189BD3BC|nr:hypothetical protein [Weissella confusa]